MEKGKSTIKIAAVTEDGATISQHFGRAPYYAVYTVENGEITHRELREKFGHQHVSGEEHHHEPNQPHGFDAAAQDRHGRMIDAIRDCQVLLARGMGMGARYSLEQAGIETILTDIGPIDAAVRAYVAGELEDHPERAH